MKKEMHVNKLRDILEKHFGKSVVIKEVSVAEADHQSSPTVHKVNIGGVLTLYLEVR